MGKMGGLRPIRKKEKRKEEVISAPTCRVTHIEGRPKKRESRFDMGSGPLAAKLMGGVRKKKERPLDGKKPTQVWHQRVPTLRRNFGGCKNESVTKIGQPLNS